MLGISRQTYSALETRKYPLPWETYLALLLVFDNNEKTTGISEAVGAFPQELRDVFNVSHR